MGTIMLNDVSEDNTAKEIILNGIPPSIRLLPFSFSYRAYSNMK